MAFQNGSGCTRIDCPESKQAFGTRAKQFTGDLTFGKTVTVRVRDGDAGLEQLYIDEQPLVDYLRAHPTQ